MTSDQREIHRKKRILEYAERKVLELASMVLSAHGGAAESVAEAQERRG